MSDQKIFCPECGNELDDNLKAKLLAGNTVYCITCGKAFQSQTVTINAKEEKGFGAGLKKFGKKLEQDIKKVSSSIEDKIKDAKGGASTPKSTAPPQSSPQSQPQTAPPPQSTPPPKQNTQSQYTPPPRQNTQSQYTPPPPQSSQSYSNQRTRPHGSSPDPKWKGGLRFMFQRMQPMTQTELEERRLRQQAERNVMQAQFYRMHVLTYFLINMLLLVLNLTLIKGTNWVLWPVCGWGLAVLIHTFNYIDSRLKKPAGFFTRNIYYYIVVIAFLLFVDTFDGVGFTKPVDFVVNVAVIWGSIILILFVFNFYWRLESVQEEMRTSTKPDLLKNPVVITHVLTYVLFNGMAFIADLLFSMKNPWYYWTLIGWGLLVGTHLIISLLYGVLDLTISGFLLFGHTLTFLSVNILLICINMYNTTTQTFSDPITWAYYPMLFWGVFYILHVIVFVVWLRTPTTDQVNKELERLKAQRNP